VVKPSRVADSAFSLECTLHHMVPIGYYTLLVGHVRRIHARSDVLMPDGSTVDASKVKPVTRLASRTGNTYARMGEVFDIPGPVWNEVKDDVTTTIAQRKSQS
jgi:flavin reductase (DIM6/NTAB) family NADH-FMN oxidoreductase RutF